MKHCETVVLKDLIQDSKDGEWGKENYFNDSIEMIVIRATDFEKVMSGRYEEIPQRFIKKQIAERKKLFEKDIILETAGGGKDRPTGRTILLNRKFCKKTQMPITCASFCRFIRIDVSKALPEYIYYKLQYLYNEGFIRQFHTQHTGVARFQYTTFATTYQFEIPSYSSQQKIASILSNYDGLIENNTRRIEILEQMAKQVYEEWFVKLRFPGHENIKMIPSELGEIPEEWEVKKLPDLCSKVIDGTHDSPKPSENGYYLVTGKHIINGFIDFSKCYMISSDEHAKVIQRSKPEKGDIIFSNIGTLGSTAIVDQDFEFSIKNVALFKPIKDFYSNYLYLHFSSLETYNRMERKASGTSQKFFSLNFIRNLEIIEPPKDLLHKFDKTVKPLIEERSILNKKNQNLRKTRDLLLPKLFSGEIDVSDLDICIRNESEGS